MVSVVVWITVIAIIILIALTALVTWAVIFFNNKNRNKFPSTFSCSIPTPPVYPSCGLQTVSSGISGRQGYGFFSSADLITMPTVKPSMISPSPTPPLIGYYHAHPTGYYNVTSSPGVIYSYPFVLQVYSGTTPSMRLAALTNSTTVRETGLHPPQYAYEATGLGDGYMMDIPCAAGGTPFVPNFEPYPLNSARPTLSSVLSSTQASRRVRLIMNQGSPFMMLAVTDIAGPLLIPALSTSGYTSTETLQLNVPNPPSRVVNAYYFWQPSGKLLVWFVDSLVHQSVTFSRGTATLNLGIPLPGPWSAIVYISMFSPVGPLLNMVVQTIANSLSPHFIQVEDIIPSADNTAMQYTLQPIPDFSLVAGSSTLWIVPPTAFRVAALGAVTLPSPLYLDFPIGNGIFQTNPQVGSAVYTSFFTLWPPESPPISDFTSYTLPNAGSGFSDTSNQVPADTDLYYLAMAIRIMYRTVGGQSPTDEQLNTCVTSFSNKVNAMGVGSDNTLFVPASPSDVTLGPQDAGLVSRVSYMLTTFLHLNSIRGLLPTNASYHGLITNAGPAISVLIESGLTTASLGAQAANPVIAEALYRPLGFFDCYSCTIPIIKTVGYTVPPIPTLTQVTSRLGEVLSYLWAADFLVSNGFANASPKIPRLSRALFSMTLEATTRLLRGQCILDPPLQSLAPVMPWMTNISQTSTGFQDDGYTPGGSSPDSLFLQTFVPFSPATHLILRPLISPLTIAVEKLIRCVQPIPQAPPASYFFGTYIDPMLAGYFTYLYTTGDRTQMLISGRPDADVSPFIKLISLQHPSVALLMNQAKLGTTTQVLVTRF